MEAQKKILCPVDFSEHSDRALSRACEAAIHNKAKLYILHVEAVNVTTLPNASGYDPELDEYRRLIEEAKPDSPDVNYEQHYAHGDVAREIVRFAMLRDVDQIVMGTHGRTGLLQSLMGSIASSVCRLAKCEVETVRPATARPEVDERAKNA